VFKTIKSKKNFYKLEIEDLKDDDENTKPVLLSHQEIVKMKGNHAIPVS